MKNKEQRREALVVVLVVLVVQVLLVGLMVLVVLVVLVLVVLMVPPDASSVAQSVVSPGSENPTAVAPPSGEPVAPLGEEKGRQFSKLSSGPVYSEATLSVPSALKICPRSSGSLASFWQTKYSWTFTT